MSFIYSSDSAEATQFVAHTLSKHLHPGMCILLEGDLGAGKTTFVGGVGKAIGIEETIASPTFNILKCYFDSKPPLYHIDAYRLEDQNIDLGLEEFIEGNGVCFIEWPQYISPILPEEFLRISFYHKGGNQREIVFEAKGEMYQNILKELEDELHD